MTVDQIDPAAIPEAAPDEPDEPVAALVPDAAPGTLTALPDPLPEPPDEPTAEELASLDRPDRSAAMKLRHREQLDAVFGKPGVHFDIIKEVHLPEGQKFKTPFGNYGRHGWVIRESGTQSADNKGGVLYTIGKSALRIAITEYKVIDPLPEPTRGRPPKR